MKKISYNKLVRDKIPEIISADGGKRAETAILSEEEFLKKAEAKLSEELAEYLNSGETEELADLLEVIYACAGAKGCSEEQLNEMRRKKAEKRGAFEKHIFLKAVYQPEEEA